MLKPLLILLATALAAAASAAATPGGRLRIDAATAQPKYVAVANGKTVEKKARPKAGKKPRKASRAEAPASSSSK